MIDKKNKTHQPGTDPATLKPFSIKQIVTEILAMASEDEDTEELLTVFLEQEIADHLEAGLQNSLSLAHAQQHKPKFLDQINNILSTENQKRLDAIRPIFARMKKNLD